MSLPVLPGQADLLLSQEQTKGRSNHRGFIITFPAAVRPEHIAQGVRHAVHSFAALRLRFTGSARDGYLQHVVPIAEHETAIEFHDVSEADEHLRSRYVASILHRDAMEWDWEPHGVCRFVVVKAGDGTHELVVSLQQVALDRPSVDSVLNVLVAATMAAVAERPLAAVPDSYESAVIDAMRLSAADNGAVRYWEREFDLAAGAFEGHSVFPAARGHSAKATIDGAVYAALKEDSGPWGPMAVFLLRLISEWRRFEERTTLIDVHYSGRSADLEQQVGMFSVVRPLVVEPTRGRWQEELTGKVIRAAAHHHIDSCALRRLETRRGVPERPFPVFTYLRQLSDDITKSSVAKQVSISHYAASYLMARPAIVRIDDTGTAFKIVVNLNSATFSAAQTERFLRGLVAE